MTNRYQREQHEKRETLRELLIMAKDNPTRLTELAREAKPDVGGRARERVNAVLRAEFGSGYRSSTIGNAYNSLRRIERKVDYIKGEKPSRLQRVMRKSGFLPFELSGAEGRRSALGETTPDDKHKLFRATMQRMIGSRKREYNAFQRDAHNEGWSKAKTQAQWRKRILDHYRKGQFPGGIKGHFMRKDDPRIPSPWAVYKTYEKKVQTADPFGDLWETPRPVAGGGKVKDFVWPTVSRSKIRAEIREKREQVRQVEIAMPQARQIGNMKQFSRLNQKRNDLLDTIHKLEAKL